MDVDADMALDLASYFGKIGTMECLVEEGNAQYFIGPLVQAADMGCMPVVQWFVQRGCKDMELNVALIAATSRSQVEVAAYLLPHLPQHVLTANSVKILKIAIERGDESLDGISFLLRSDFLAEPAATYAVADVIARSDKVHATPKLRAFLREHWSEEAFLKGVREGEVHFSNIVKIIKRGESPILLPGSLIVAVAYLPLYRECVMAGGQLLSQRHRGQLVEACRRLGGVVSDEPEQKSELMAVLEQHLPVFFLQG